ncbi:MAG: twin-arginine translocase subunit TatC [Lacipirellulaceae bacterium]
MKQLAAEEPFEATKMSFGDHLEELRSALWKAVIALVIGFCIGLLFGGHMVRFVQQPLVAGLEELRLKQKQRRYDESRPQGAPQAPFADTGLAPETYLVDPRVLAETLRELGVAVPAEPVKKLPETVPFTLWRSLEGDPSVRPIGTGVPDAFSVYVKASFVIGAVASSPFVFYFVWSFVAAGLYPHEKRYVNVFLPFSIGLFLSGAAIAFFFVFQFVLSFLFDFYDWLEIDPTPRIDQWLSFAILLPLGFGIAFQLPLVMLFLERIGVFSAKKYLDYWRYAVLVIFIMSMILTPADPQSMLIMAGTLTPLYFGGILLCKWMPRFGGSFSERIAE